MFSVNVMSSKKRKYTLQARAERQAETRRRIARATAELHEEVGPARTTIAEIARRAGVERLTVYNNFPDEYRLFAACQQHFLTQNPPPDPSPAFAISDPCLRLEAVLTSLYDWYARTERMSAHVRRDREILPGLDALMSDTVDPRVSELAEALAAGFADEDPPPHTVRAAVRLALDFWTWRRLAHEGLDTDSAARLMSDAVRAAARATNEARAFTRAPDIVQPKSRGKRRDPRASP
jgi:AcrR family transcriptional regulator